MAHSYPDGKVTMDVTQLDLHELGLMPQPMKHPLAFNFSAEARQNRVFTHLVSGDMKLNLSARSGVEPLIRQSTHFVDVLMRQIDEKALDHAELREALPTAILSFSAGKENPLAYFLATQNISYQDASMKFGTAPDWGIMVRQPSYLEGRYFATGYHILYCQARYYLHEAACRSD